MQRNTNELEFEEVGNKRSKKQESDSDESSEEERTPNMLTLKALAPMEDIKLAFSTLPELLQKMLPEKAL